MWRTLRWTGAALFLLLVLQSAWVVDEAYITFRTVDNFLAGHGLRWNVGERVQAYTHPLWLIVMVPAQLSGANVFYVSIAVSWLFSALGLAAVWRWFEGVAPWKLPLFLLLACSSKAYVDYSTSGLENPLSHAVALAFGLQLVRREASPEPRSQGLDALFATAALGVLTRLDTVLLYAPPLAWVLWQEWPRRRLSLWRPLAFAVGPVLAWLCFSTLYYGFPLPNTFYAKVANTGVDTGHVLAMGTSYLANSLRWDAVTPAVFLLGLGVAMLRREAWALSLLAGVGLYLAYVWGSAASATHMSGRFLSLPFALCAAVAARGLASPRVAAGVAAAAVVWTVASPRAPIKFGTALHTEAFDTEYVIDTKLAVYQEGAALLDAASGVALPNHGWYRHGEAFREGDVRVVAIASPGYFAYAAGPEKWIIDKMGLGDPLLSRLPGRPAFVRKGGHYIRELPPGYRATIATAKNQLRDPGLRAYYDRLTLLTRGPLWQWQRWVEIVRMNTGREEPLLSSYRASLAPGSAAPPPRP